MAKFWQKNMQLSELGSQSNMGNIIWNCWCSLSHGTDTAVRVQNLSWTAVPASSMRPRRRKPFCGWRFTATTSFKEAMSTRWVCGTWVRIFGFTYMPFWVRRLGGPGTSCTVLLQLANRFQIHQHRCDRTQCGVSHINLNLLWHNGQ